MFGNAQLPLNVSNNQGLNLSKLNDVKTPVFDINLNNIVHFVHTCFSKRVCYNENIKKYK